MKEGTKEDAGKLRLDLIPPEALFALGEVLTYGAKKYGDKNWEKGIKYSRVYGAVLRHLLAWRAGEQEDDESFLPHLWLAFCELMFLLTFDERELSAKFNDLTGGEKI